MASRRQALPDSVKKRGRQAALVLGQATAAQRALPDFVLIGAQRCGTTSLFRALMEHPQILRPVLHKGVNYFDVNYGRGPRWYRAHFPLAAAARARTRAFGPPCLFEASGYYMYHPFAPQRMAADLPDARLIALLRDPVERAYSAHQHESARGFEWESFERALDLEDERLAGELERMANDADYQSFTHRHHSYTRRGHYADQLEAFVTLFGRDKLLIIESEAFFADPEAEFDRVVEFLGVRPYRPQRFDRYNARPSQPMSQSVRARLQEHFAPHDDKLASLLGRPPVWRTGS